MVGEGQGVGRDMVWGWEMGWRGIGEGDRLGKGDGFRKGGEERGGKGGGRQNLATFIVSAHRQTHTHRYIHRHTKVKTEYPPVSLRSLGGYN